MATSALSPGTTPSLRSTGRTDTHHRRSTRLNDLTALVDPTVSEICQGCWSARSVIVVKLKGYLVTPAWNNVEMAPEGMVGGGDRLV